MTQFTVPWQVFKTMIPGDMSHIFLHKVYNEEANSTVFDLYGLLSSGNIVLARSEPMKPEEELMFIEKELSSSKITRVLKVDSGLNISIAVKED